MSSGGSSGKSTSVTQNYSPEEAARRAKVMSEAERVYGQTQGQAAGPYPGAKPIDASLATLLGQGMLSNAAGLGTQANSQMANALTYGLEGSMDVGNNPYFQGALEAALRPQQQALTEGLQQVGSAAQAQGAYGGARHGIAEVGAFDKAAQSISDTTAKMGSDAYAKGQDTFARTLGLAPSTVAAYSQPASFMSAVGAQQENLSAEQEAYRAAQRQWELNAPWLPLENYANIVYGGGGTQATTTASGGGAQRNPLMGAAGGALTGWAAGAAMGSSLGPWGAAAGAVLGALM